MTDQEFKRIKWLCRDIEHYGFNQGIAEEITHYTPKLLEEIDNLTKELNSLRQRFKSEL